MMRPALLLLLALVPAVAWGRIGETRAQLESRYGTGKEVGDQVLYATDLYSITVFFSGEGAQARSVMEIFARRLDGDGNRPELTPEETQRLLDEQGAGQGWVKVANGASGAWAWCRADSRVFARPEKEALVFRGKDGIGGGGARPGVVLRDGKAAAH